MDGAFEDFVAADGGRLLRVSLLLTGNAADAEDLLQDVFVRMYLKWPTVQDPHAYARAALTRGVTDRWRRTRRRVREVPLPDGTERAGPGAVVDATGVAVRAAVGDGAAARAERAAVVDQLRRLPPRQRAVIVLRYFEDWSEARIAAELDITTGTVKSQAAKGLARLRDLMQLSATDAGPSWSLPAPGPTRRSGPAQRSRRAVMGLLVASSAGASVEAALSWAGTVEASTSKDSSGSGVVGRSVR